MSAKIIVGGVTVLDNENDGLVREIRDARRSLGALETQAARRRSARRRLAGLGLAVRIFSARAELQKLLLTLKCSKPNAAPAMRDTPEQFRERLRAQGLRDPQHP